MATRRTERLGRLIQVELAELLLKRVKDPRLGGVTLTGVDVSPDLAQAKVFFSLFEESHRREAERGFLAAAAFLRRELAGRLNFKTTPRLVPVFDKSLSQGVRLEEIIRRARQIDDAAVQARGEAGGDDAGRGGAGDNGEAPR
jgi:ribosome-binding factor A